MVQCPGKTKKGGACKRVVVPGAAMCEDHYKIQQGEEAEAQRQSDYDRHCKTKCKGQGYEYDWCDRGRLSPDNPLCKKCNDALVADEKRMADIEKAREEAAKHQADYQRRRQEEVARFHAFTSECEWWPGFEHWFNDKLAELEGRIDNCKQLSYDGSM